MKVRGTACWYLAALALLAAPACGDDDEGEDAGTLPARVAGTLEPFTPGRTTAQAEPTEFALRAAEALLAARPAATARVRPDAPPRPLDPGAPLVEPGRDFVPGELLLRLRADDPAGGGAAPGPAARARDPELPALGAGAGGRGFTLAAHRRLGPATWAVRLRDPARPDLPVSHAETLEAAGRLAARPEVLVAEPNYYRWPRRTPNDSLYELQWHYRQIGLPAAWDISTGSADVVVAVLDDGVNAHPDLDARLLPGYDMVSQTRFSGDGDGRDPDPSQVPDSQGGRSLWHGLHVAGTIGAVTDNDYGAAGVDWAARILPVRVLGVYVPDEGAGTSADVIDGIRWAAGGAVEGVPDNPTPADVINLSLGGGGLVQLEQDAVDFAVSQGATVVVAAGNDDEDASQTSLGGYENVIVVGATDYYGSRAPYSNWGPAVDVMAPGGSGGTDANADGYPDGVLSLWLSDDGEEDEAFFLAGTSMATPHVSGLVALLLSVDPELTPARIEELLKATADPAGQCEKGCGAGLVNAAAALRAAGGGQPDAAPELLVSGSRLNLGTDASGQVFLFNAGGGTLTWEASLGGDDAGRLDFATPASGTLEAGASAALRVAVDRTDLPEGDYQASLGIVSNGGEWRLPVFFSVGPLLPADLGEVVVGTVTVGADDEIVVGGQTVTRLAEGYAYEVDTEPGAWFVVAVADADGDGEADQIGFWKSLDAIEGIRLAAGETRQDVDFVLAPYEDHGTVPCAAFRACVEACGEDTACVDQCPLEDACLTCLHEEVFPCEDASGCGDDTACLCEACDGAYEACFGPAACLPGGSGGAVEALHPAR